MMDWKAKLGSRKFWSLVAALVTAILTALNAAPGTIERIVAIIGAFGSIAVYIIAEAYIDAKAAGANIIDIEKLD
jgi:hypothetical protein